MQKFVLSAAVLLAVATMSCSAVRLQSPVTMRSHASNEVKGTAAGPWWHDPRVVAVLALSADQRVHLDAIARRANDELAAYEQDARLAGSFVDTALNDDPFDVNAFNYVLAEYTMRQARLVARDLQSAGEIRSVLTHAQWTALQQDAAVKMQANKDDRQ